jgi:GNAT superfamily N-acetyltransferase
MEITREDRVRMERAHVHAWPALRTADLNGWLWRSSGGGSQRANSVSTIDFTGDDLAGAIETVEARYRAIEMPAQFYTYDETLPPMLAERLRARGYVEGDATLTMFKRPEPIVAQAQVEIREDAGDEWCGVYLGAITESRRAVNRQILTAIPKPRAFFGCRTGGQMVSTALCVVGHGCAVIECVATRPESRRQGSAVVVLTGLLSWAAQQDVDLIGLQVVAGNAPAIRLYETLGFVPGATNRCWHAAGGD